MARSRHNTTHKMMARARRMRLEEGRSYATLQRALTEMQAERLRNTSHVNPAEVEFDRLPKV